MGKSIWYYRSPSKIDQQICTKLQRIDWKGQDPGYGGYIVIYRDITLWFKKGDKLPYRVKFTSRGWYRVYRGPGNLVADCYLRI